MKPTIAALLLAIATPLFAQDAERPTPPPPPVPPTDGRTYDYDQKPAPGRAPILTAEQAQGIIDKFKAAYAKLGAPRVMVYVNRELIDEDAGLKLIARTEKVDTTTQTTTSGVENKTENQPTEAARDGKSTTTEKAARENRYRRGERKDLTLADRQTVRDVERLFGRPFRMAGARLADQRLATQMIPDRPLKSLATEGEQARKDREALAKFGDVAVEILVSSKKVEVTELSGTRTYELPDIQATALRLQDSQIIGQASSSDVMRGNPAYYARNFDVREITEAVALALMEDMLPSSETAATEPK